MIKQLFLAASMIFLALLFTSCSALNSSETQTPAISEIQSISNSEYAKTEYIKISAKEAQSMMADDVVILDVRTKEEFDEGHIVNAVLLPDFKIKESAESVISDKNQTILVYCRTGRRSELASKELIDMGYTKVFDFGGIVDWTGEIVNRPPRKLHSSIFAAKFSMCFVSDS